MEIKVTEEEINKVLNRCAENTDAGKVSIPVCRMKTVYRMRLTGYLDIGMINLLMIRF